jgi:hypothetical protein
MSNTISIVTIIKDENGCEKSSKLIHESEVSIPEKIGDLGLTQSNQQEIVEKIQQTVINNQTKGLAVFNDGVCPECGAHLRKNGSQKSTYHGVYADSNIYISKYDCSSRLCKWSHNPSVLSHFGDNISPELAKIQAELGATLSFRKAKNSLKLMSGKNRSINNHMRIRETVFSTGKGISEYNSQLFKNSEQENSSKPELCYQNEACGEYSYNYNKELIIGVDGAYIHDADLPGHNFEAMVAKIYNPENISEVSKDRYAITKKQCVGSAMKDEQKIMKGKVLEAAKLEGLDKNTKVVGLADGARNCWNVIESIAPHCAFLLCILDWFHIAKYFTSIKKQLPHDAKGFLDSAHGALWYGETEMALICLRNLLSRLTEKSYIEKVEKLITYIDNNKDYIVSYEDRSIQGLPFSSQMAESTVEHFVAERFKKKQKMAWIRQSSHNVLQVRGSIISNTYDNYWHEVHGVAQPN